MTPGERFWSIYAHRGVAFRDIDESERSRVEGAAAAVVADVPKGFLVCDTCGQFHLDNLENLSASCDCGRFLQRVEWVTLADLRKMRDELAALRAVVERQAKAIGDAHEQLCDAISGGICSLGPPEYVVDETNPVWISGMILAKEADALAAAEAAKAETTQPRSA